MPCIVCQRDLTAETDSAEHVFPNAIGGVLMVSDLLCRECNSRAGETWDAGLAKQMHAMCTIFHVVRQRGETPALATVTTAGEALTILPDGTLRLTDPDFKRARTEKGTEISIVARDMHEARTMLQGLKRRYPHLDVNALLEKAEAKTSYPEGVFKHDFSFGGEQAGRSMVKTAAAFARHLGIPTDACDLAAAYLRNESGEAPFGYYWTSDLVTNRRVGVPIHCVAVSADPASGLLLGYGEYFGAVRIVTCLSQTYRRQKIRGSYAIDPTTGNTPLMLTYRCHSTAKTWRLSTDTSTRRQRNTKARWTQYWVRQWRETRNRRDGAQLRTPQSPRWPPKIPHLWPLQIPPLDEFAMM